MNLIFIFSHLNAIALSIWVTFLIIVTIRFFRPGWVKNVSYWKLILIAALLNILYGLFVTWGQYYVWSNGSDLTRSLLNLPLPKEVPFPFYLTWTRLFFEHQLGYFSYYVLGRFWLNILISFLISGVLYFIFKIWKSRRGNFTEHGPEILLLLMLISGYPGILVLIPLGFIFAVLWAGFYYFKGNQAVNIEPAFILAAFFALLFSRIILNMV